MEATEESERIVETEGEGEQSAATVQIVLSVRRAEAAETEETETEERETEKRRANAAVAVAEDARLIGDRALGQERLIVSGRELCCAKLKCFVRD